MIPTFLEKLEQLTNGSPGNAVITTFLKKKKHVRPTQFIDEKQKKKAVGKKSRKKCRTRRTRRLPGEMEKSTPRTQVSA